MEKKIIYLYYFTLFFPYFTFIKIRLFDLQPYNLIFSMIFILINFYVFYTRIPKDFYILLLVVIISIEWLFFSYDYFYGLKNVFGYISIFMGAVTSYLIFKKGYKFPSKLFIYSNFIWFIGGIIQMFFGKHIWLFTSRVSTSIERGVTSFAPEPSYYGLNMLIFIYFTHEFIKQKKMKYVMYILEIIQILFMAKSAISFLIFIAFLVIYKFMDIFLKKKIYEIPLLILIILILFLFVNEDFLSNFNNIRLVDVLIKLKKDPVKLLIMDESASDRIGHIIYSLQGSYYNFFFPHRYGEWKLFINNISKYLNTTNIVFNIKTTRIMSAYGMMMFTLGIFSFPLIYIINKNLIKNIHINKDFFGFVLLNIILINQIPIANPFIGYILGFYIYKNRSFNLQKSKFNNNNNNK
ncbi:hypothetical protein XO10_05925 [Marinitoga sp. 1135]|uniref:hypothetical protein n=1 Tax=Marinitoga sp. 1135 TaxID=1643333 RepID=UPI0015860835|nr:hypothetical protein [Marinitoga sp. 1135]NUU95818.1 hypothetical protein [Marinitoga sp. 1135]